MIHFKGDLNDDGRITMVDLPLCIKAATGQFIDDGRGDVDDDGQTTLTDVSVLLDHINGVSLVDGVINDA